MDEVYHKINRYFPCRSGIIKHLANLLDPEDALPAVIYLHGHTGTGKTTIVKKFLRQTRRYKPTLLRAGHLNCIEGYTSKILFEQILELLNADKSSESDAQKFRCDNLKEFIEILRNMNNNLSYILVLDNAERLRDMDSNILPSLLRLQELCGLNICSILMSQIPFEKYFCKTGLSEVLTLFFPQYTKNETSCILFDDFDTTIRMIKNIMKQKLNNNDDEFELRLTRLESIPLDFYKNYLNIFLSVFYKACRDLPELKITARRCFVNYLEPVLDGSVEATDVSRLWRNVAAPLKTALSQVYMRFDQFEIDHIEEHNTDHQQRIQKMTQALELPYYGKYLLIAAFLASYNSAKEDKRLFVKNHGKQRKRMQAVNAKAKVSEQMSTSVGPKSFTIDRLLAIFYAILDDKVGITCNLLSQILTLVHLKLLCFVSGENSIMDGSARLQCTVNLQFILYIGKVVDFNVRQYLCDFM